MFSTSSPDSLVRPEKTFFVLSPLQPICSPTSARNRCSQSAPSRMAWIRRLLSALIVCRSFLAQLTCRTLGVPAGHRMPVFRLPSSRRASTAAHARQAQQNSLLAFQIPTARDVTVAALARNLFTISQRHVCGLSVGFLIRGQLSWVIPIAGWLDFLPTAEAGGFPCLAARVS